MLLAIDVGNTQTHLGMFRGDELVEHWRFATVRFATTDELATVLASLLDLRDLRLRDVDAAIVSSVVPTLAHEYEGLIERYLDGQGALVGPALLTPGVIIAGPAAPPATVLSLPPALAAGLPAAGSGVAASTAWRARPQRT